MGILWQRYCQRPDLPSWHPLQGVNSRLYNENDPLWKQMHGGGEVFNPAKIPIALECVDLSEIRIGSLEDSDIDVDSETTGSSGFWSNSAKSASSQSSNEDRCVGLLSGSRGESAKLDPEPASLVLTSVEVGATRQSETATTPALARSTCAEPTLKVEQNSFQPDFVPMRVSTAKIDPEKTGFLDLPGEIRNRIYDLALPKENDLEITWLTRGKELTHYRHRLPISKKPKDVIYGKLRPGDRAFNGHFRAAIRNKAATIKRRQQTRAQAQERRATYAKEKKTGEVSLPPSDWTLQTRGFATLLGLNRQLHDEAASLFYSRSTFSFASRALLDKFLDNLTPIGRAHLCKIYLAHDMESPSMLKSDRVFKEKERKKWVATLQALSSKCKSLEELHILTNLRGSRFQLDLTDTWSQDLTTGLSNLRHLTNLKAFDLGLILGDDSSDVRAANSTLPQDHERIGRATQLDCAADMVRRQLFSAEQIEKMELEKRKKITNPLILRITHTT
ncbi:hypothetical protein MMC10_001990 [Thelotrema lepadinum]|nr:hypothetical protein [Thelotrema lepadinum]